MKFKDGSPTGPENDFFWQRARRSTTHEYVILFKMLRALLPGHSNPAEGVDKITHNIQHTTYNNTETEAATTPHTHKQKTNNIRIKCEQIFFVFLNCMLNSN